jgi:hypothetical protein
VRLTDWLMYNGFQVHTKRAKLFERAVTGSSGDRTYLREVKGNIEIEMVVEALTASAGVTRLSSSAVRANSPHSSKPCNLKGAVSSL